MPYSGLTTTVSVALVPADSASLVPAALVEKADGGLPKAETREGRRPVGARLSRRPDRRLGPRHLRDPDHARRADAGLHGAQRRRGVADLVPRGPRPDHGRGRPADHLERRDRLPDARAGDDEGRSTRCACASASRCGAPRARSGRSGPRRRCGSAYARPPTSSSRWRRRASRPSKVVVALRDTARAYRKLNTAADHRTKRGWKRARSVRRQGREGARRRRVARPA